MDRRLYLLVSAGILALGLALRLAPSGQHRFHEDEALYAYWGRQIAAGADPLLDHEPVDKPPLLFYLQALTFLACGPSEMAARLPNLFAGLAGLVAVWALAGRVYGRSTSLLALLALALNPFDIAFAGTAFTDPLMIALASAGLALTVAGRPGWAGWCLGLACAAKQQGVFFVPLALGAGLLWPAARPQGASGAPAAPGRGLARLGAWFGRPLARGALGFLAGAGPALLWDLVRTKRPGYLAQSWLSYGGLSVASPAAWGQRAGEWLEVLRLAPGWPLGVVAGGALALALVAARVVSGAQLHPDRAAFPGARLRGAQPDLERRRAGFDLLLLGFILLFLLGHWLLTFRPWDRYLLGLIPLWALLAGRALILPARVLGRWRTLAGPRLGYGLLGAALLLATLGPAALTAARGEYPAGGDRGAYQGIEQVAAYVRGALPPEAIVHQRRLGWHFAYYLYGAPHALRWYATPAELIANATEWPAVPQWLVLRAWDSDAEERAALAQLGLTLHDEYLARRPDGSVSFRVCRLAPP